jgi:hypothetical protein
MNAWRRWAGGILLVGLLAACGQGPVTPLPIPTVNQTAYPIYTPEPTATPEPPLMVDWPLSGSAVGSPLTLRGRIAAAPQEGRLVARLYDAQGSLLAQSVVSVTGAAGSAGTFAGGIEFAVPPTPGAGRLEVMDVSADGSQVRAVAQVEVLLGQTSGTAAIEVPAPGVKVTLPLHVLANVGQPGQAVKVVLVWQDGTQLSGEAVPLARANGQGVVITSLDWNSESQPPQPATQPAMVEIRDSGGQLLAQQPVTVLSADDPGSRMLTVYWTLGAELQPVQVRVPWTPAVGTAALEALLWGPTPGNLAGFETAVPQPAEILAVAGAAPEGWGTRVQLRLLKIVDGVAMADFSRELNLWSVAGETADSPARRELIRKQITETLLQFSTVKEVQITVEGQPF